jgi:hypothetical protein
MTMTECPHCDPTYPGWRRFGSGPHDLEPCGCAHDPANWKPCPDCGGEGEIQIGREFTDEGMTRVDEKRGPVRECSTCEGTKWVPA